MELFLGIGGIIIALGAAITTIWQGFLTRKHNRLSVKPILQIDIDLVSNNRITISLKNQGVGPAVITSLQYFVDNSLVVENGSNIQNEVINKLNLGIFQFKFTELIINDSLIAGEERNFLSLQNPNINDVELKKIKRAFEKLKIKIEYKSIYEEEFKYEWSVNR